MIACNEGGNEEGGSESGSATIKLQNLDIGDAKYLSLLGSPVRSQTGDSDAGLFMIDGHGNLSTVVLTCTEERGGTITQERKDIKVIPESIVSLPGGYTVMQCCDFMTGQGAYVDLFPYYDPGKYGDFNIIVRNSDGKIFYIPQSVDMPDWQGDMSFALDKDNDLYYEW